MDVLDLNVHEKVFQEVIDKFGKVDFSIPNFFASIKIDFSIKILLHTFHWPLHICRYYYYYHISGTS